MESAETPVKVRYAITTTVVRVYERTKEVYLGGIGKEAVFREESLGWFVHLFGSDESIFLGTEKPDFEAGDKIKITFEKVE